jgi:hypothetical protein
MCPRRSVKDLNVKLKKEYQDAKAQEYSMRKQKQKQRQQTPAYIRTDGQTENTGASKEASRSCEQDHNNAAPPSAPAINDSCRRSDSKDKECDYGDVISGELWYKQQAFRAVNQAIGRCIRYAIVPHL